MNSQQELLDAINTISQSKDKSYDTPATVLRVEGETVWVHIDGGADETPVQKTINCSEGEIVQVRISNGSAFLVGNASAPPTDDTTANVAHFIAEEADVKATEAIRSVNAIVQTVQGKVDSGGSNVTDLSSTMYQNEYGVNIYNDTLDVGDSYAHIDGDSFDIKEVTTVGQIDDTNDPVVASFGADESVIKSSDATTENKLTFNSNNFVLTKKTLNDPNSETGWEITPNKIGTKGYLDTYNIYIDKTTPIIHIGPGNTGQSTFYTTLTNRSIEVGYPDANEITSIIPDAISVMDEGLSQIVLLSNGNVSLTGDVYAHKKVGDTWVRDYKKTPTILTSSTISASTTSYTFSNSAITTSSVIDVYDSIFGFSPTNMSTSAGRCTITFPAQSSSHQIKLFIY